MKKIAVNRCYGGFSLSPEATLKLYERGVTEIATPIDQYWSPESRLSDDRFGYAHALREWRSYLAGTHQGGGLFLTVFSPDEQHVLYAREIRRDHPELVRVIEEMGEKANGGCAALDVTEIPDGVEWQIEEYDGREWVSEKHRTW